MSHLLQIFGRKSRRNTIHVAVSICPGISTSLFDCSSTVCGRFLSSFQNQNNLHIGLTSSNGTIYEFDVKGLVKTPFNNRTVALKDESWDQCLVIAQVPESWYDRWDEVLEQISTDQSWSEEMYEKDSHNCYSFVLGFLKALEYGEFSALCHDKLLFSERIVASKTQNAAKYITIHRKLQGCNYFTEEQE